MLAMYTTNHSTPTTLDMKGLRSITVVRSSVRPEEHLPTGRNTMLLVPVVGVFAPSNLVLAAIGAQDFEAGRRECDSATIVRRKDIEDPAPVRSPARAET